jgi:tetratricopeptide (TPR) repeat protein
MKKKTENFIDKTFTVLANLLLKLLPATKAEKQAFAYYRSGMDAQTIGNYAEALENYYEALKLEEDPYDRSYIYFNMGIIFHKNGQLLEAINYYNQALELNAEFPQVLNNLAVIYHSLGAQEVSKKDFGDAAPLFTRAAYYWKIAICLAPNGYPEAQNWLKVNNL